jgi:IclR family acetate operon transcriptional repressor
MGSSRGSLERGVDILTLLAAADPPGDAVAVASRLHLPRSTVYRLLQSLRKRGLVIAGTAPGSLRLGLVFLRWAAVVQTGLRIVDLASPHLDALARLTGETANLYLLEGDHAVPVDQRVTSARLRVVTEEGVALPLHAGAALKAILAFLPTARWEQVVKRGLFPFGPKTITDPRRLHRDLEVTRARGYAQSDEEVLEGARGLAAPIFEEHGKVIGSLGIGGPRDRFRGEALRRAVQPVLRAADALSVSLGFHSVRSSAGRTNRSGRARERTG